MAKTITKANTWISGLRGKSKLDHGNGWKAQKQAGKTRLSFKHLKTAARRSRSQHSQSRLWSTNNGFSLIELAVVITVLTILVAVSLPTFYGVQEVAADKLVKHEMIKAYKECKVSTIRGAQTPKYTVMIGMHNTNGYYKFYQRYNCIRRRDGSCAPTKIGNCFGPLGAHHIGVRKVKGDGKGGELWINLNTGVKTQRGGVKWDN